MCEEGVWEWDVPVVGAQTHAAALEGDAAAGTRAARRRDRLELDVLRASPGVLEVVRSRTRVKKGRTPEVPVRCGRVAVGDRTVSGVAFGVLDGAAELIRFRRIGSELQPLDRLTGPGTSPGVLTWACSCWGPSLPGASPQVSVLTLYQAALRVLAGGGMASRPVVNVHHLVRGA